MRSKKQGESAGGGGGGASELFICFTGRDPHPPATPSLSASLSRRRSGSLKSGAHSPMFSSAAAAGAVPRRRGSSAGGFEAAEPSSPKVTCIGQVRVKGGKRRPRSKKPPLPPGSAALRSRSRREASFRHDRAQQQGWVYQIPVSICEAVKAVVPCSGGKSRCGSRGAEDDPSGKKRPRRGGGCGGAISRWLVAVDNDEEEGEGAAVGEGSCEKAKVGMVMAGWDEREVAGGVVELEKEMKREVFVLSKEEADEGPEEVEKARVSVCVPPPNALLLMRCRSDPVRMAALATRFWGSPAAAAAPVEKGRDLEDSDDSDDDEEADEHEEEVVLQEDGDDEDKVDGTSAEKEEISVDIEVAGVNGSEADESNQDSAFPATAEGGSDDLGEKLKKEQDCPAEVDAGVVTVPGRDMEVTEMTGNDGDGIQKDGSNEKGDECPAKACSLPSGAKDSRKLLRSGSLCGMRVRRCSSAREKGGHRHSFSNEREARRPSFSNQKDARRASFSVEHKPRWSFAIEHDQLIAELRNRKAGTAATERVQEVEQSVETLAVEVSVSQEPELPTSEDQNVESAEKLKDEDPGEAKEEKEEVKVNKEKLQVKKKSGELPDCLLLMMYEPKLSMEVSKETWVCSTDFVHWEAYNGGNRRSHPAKAKPNTNPKANAVAATGDAAATSAAGGDCQKNATDSNPAEPPTKPVPPPPPAAAAPQPRTVKIEKKLILELPVVATSAYAPFVLKRCKSEPLRSSARLAPDACFWKERHRPIGATGLGF